MSKVTAADFPIKTPCFQCMWNTCWEKKKACDKLWEWLAFRGDWVMDKNRGSASTARK